MPLSISLSLLSGNILSRCTNWKLSNSSRRSSAFDTSASDTFSSASRNSGNARLIKEVTSTRSNFLSKGSYWQVNPLQILTDERVFITKCDVNRKKKINFAEKPLTLTHGRFYRPKTHIESAIKRSSIYIKLTLKFCGKKKSVLRGLGLKKAWKVDLFKKINPKS